MKAKIVNFRRSRHVQRENQMIINTDNVDSIEKATKLVDKDVVFTTESGKEIKGKISGAHGNKGAMKVIFEKGMPGQAIGQEVEIKN